ncbi:MAG: hypothetical protein CMQ24_21460 [Gammaproteobacteria bacterium]|nr:hypothetical protein [Gammaproteobacteria bacterium]
MSRLLTTVLDRMEQRDLVVRRVLSLESGLGVALGSISGEPAREAVGLGRRVIPAEDRGHLPADENPRSLLRTDVGHRLPQRDDAAER